MDLKKYKIKELSDQMVSKYSDIYILTPSHIYRSHDETFYQFFLFPKKHKWKNMNIKIA